MLESEIAQRYMSTRERYLHGRHLIDSVCCTTLSRYQDNIIVCTVLPPLAAKFFLAPSRLDDGRPRENFTAAIIPVRWLHPKPYAHHLTTSPPRKLASSPAALLARSWLCQSQRWCCASHVVLTPTADRCPRVLSIYSQLAHRVFAAQR